MCCESGCCNGEWCDYYERERKNRAYGLYEELKKTGHPYSYVAAVPASGAITVGQLIELLSVHRKDLSVWIAVSRTQYGTRNVVPLVASAIEQQHLVATHESIAVLLE